ncbi:MAG: leucine-rich repeat domain-containing protein [Akkermansiaceae bacterium]|nr:leucine-rich repeat domain-containing protein [Akkermansiaceae bacterium]
MRLQERSKLQTSLFEGTLNHPFGQAESENVPTPVFFPSVTSIGDFAFEYCRRLTAVTFLGNAPKIENTAFETSSPTIYRKADAKGWSDTLAGRPVKLITEKP